MQTESLAAESLQLGDATPCDPAAITLELKLCVASGFRSPKVTSLIPAMGVVSRQPLAGPKRLDLPRSLLDQIDKACFSSTPGMQHSRRNSFRDELHVSHRACQALRCSLR